MSRKWYCVPASAGKKVTMNDLLKSLVFQSTVRTGGDNSQLKLDEKKLIEATAQLCVQSMRWVADNNNAGDEARSAIHAAEMRICKLCDVESPYASGARGLLPTPRAVGYQDGQSDLYTRHQMLAYGAQLIDQCLNIIAAEQQATGETWQGKDGVNIWWKIADLMPT